jgi:methyl-accepting chemotaxis protein
MTGEEMEKAVAFVLEQQTQLTVTVGRLSDSVGRMAEKVELIAEKVNDLAHMFDRMTEKLDRITDSVTALLAIAEIHDREIKETDERGRQTDERLNALINTVERYISERRNGKA